MEINCNANVNPQNANSNLVKSTELSSQYVEKNQANAKYDQYF